MESQKTLPTDIVELIRNFVDRVEIVLLKRQLTRQERVNICDEIESQIHTMIERRLETGAELNLELVNGIIESMDQPESYAQGDEPMTENAIPLASASSTNTSQPSLESVASQIESRAQTAFKQFRSSLPTGSIRWLFSNRNQAFAGMVGGVLGVLMILFGMGMNHHQEPWLVFGMMLLFLGTIVSAVSYWRSRKSDSSTNGRRYAALGIMIMPTFFINGMLASLVIAGRLWMLLGVVAALGFFLYANYRVLSYGLRFLEADSNHESSATSVEPEATVVADMATPVSQVSLTPGV